MQKQQNHSPRIVKPWQNLMCKPDQNGSSLTTWHVVADSEGGGELQLTFPAGRLPEGSSANSSTFSGTIPPPLPPATARAKICNPGCTGPSGMSEARSRVKLGWAAPIRAGPGHRARSGRAGARLGHGRRRCSGRGRSCGLYRGRTGAEGRAGPTAGAVARTEAGARAVAKAGTAVAPHARALGSL